jgi:hypothetical protein
MSGNFKYTVAQLVQYTAPGKEPAFYRVARRLAGANHSLDVYFIQSVHGYEWVALETDLSVDALRVQ